MQAMSLRCLSEPSTSGGHSRAEVLNGVVYEPSGAHIFHTSDEEVAAFVKRFGLTRAYEHRVQTMLHLSGSDEPAYFSWPLQVSELRALPEWPVIERELMGLPGQPGGANFEEYVIGLMGPTLYRLFIEGYTRKQWGRDPKELSSSFAPRRVELRTDGNKRLFRDRYEFFPATGYNAVIEAVASAVVVHAGQVVDLSFAMEHRNNYDAWVVTAALDEFVGEPGSLEWRGIEMRSTYHPVLRHEQTMTRCYVINQPDLRYPHTRTVETKHASGQLIAGTVVSYEYPGSNQRHYPVLTVDHLNETRNAEFKALILEALGPRVFFCGRLANYEYINQDQAIRQGIDTALAVLRDA